MWDIISYIEKDICLLIRQRDLHYVFGYPWREPKAIPTLLASPKAEAINIPTDKLRQELLIRARVCALNHLCNLARGGLNGAPADSAKQLQFEALKFALKRKKMGVIAAHEFIRMLTSCALLEPIPESFWNACAGVMAEETLQKLKDSLETLSVFHPKDDLWLTPAAEYLRRTVWMQNEFALIETVSRQLAAFHSKTAIGDVYAELRKMSTNLIQRDEIEKTLMTQKPWQRNALPMKKSIRIGPQSRSKPVATSQGESDDTQTDDTQK